MRFLFRPFIATVCHGDIYRAIPAWVPWLPMLHFGGRRGCNGVQLLRMVVSSQSAIHANLGELVGNGVAQIGRSSVERFATLWGIRSGFECLFTP